MKAACRFLVCVWADSMVAAFVVTGDTEKEPCCGEDPKLGFGRAGFEGALKHPAGNACRQGNV